MKIQSNNIVTIGIVKNPILRDRTKHVKLDQHFTKDCVRHGKTMLFSMNSQVADVLTKFAKCQV